MMMRVVIPAKAGIQIENTGFRIKSGMTKCIKVFLRQYTRYFLLTNLCQVVLEPTRAYLCYLLTYQRWRTEPVDSQ